MLILLATACSSAFDDHTKEPRPGDDGVDTAETGDTADTVETADTTDSDSAETGDTADSGDTGDTDTGDTGPPDTAGPDADRDGTPDADDCAPDDAAIHPGATEIWYDGVDQDCDGGDDFDQDHDGFQAADWGGDDCDDLVSTTRPGAFDAPYDDVDSDCMGGSDYDADHDGADYDLYGGDDCDDNNSTVGPDALETLEDGIDSDCDGSDDGFTFHDADTRDGTGLHGPRIGVSNGQFVLTVLADELTDGGTTYETGAVINTLDLRATTGAAVEYWYWGAGTSFSGAYDFWADDDFWVYAYGLHDGTIREFSADVWESDRSASMQVYYADNTENSFDDIEITEAEDGSLHVLGCDTATGGLTRWMHADAAAFYLLTDIVGDSVEDESDACTTVPQDGTAWVGRRGAGRVDVYPLSDTVGFGSPDPDDTWSPFDVKALDRGGHTALLIAEGSSGVEVKLDGNVTTLPFTDARRMAATLDDTGRLWIAVVDDNVDLYLYWGKPGLGFDSLLLDPAMGTVDDVDLEIGDNTLMVAARSGVRVAYGVLAL